MKRLLSAVIAAAVSLSAGEVTRVPLLDFERKTMFDGIRVGPDCGTTAFAPEMDPALVVQGRTAFRFQMPSLRESGRRWPHLYISGRSLQTRDFRPFHRISFHMNSLKPGKGRIAIDVFTPGTKIGLPYFRYNAPGPERRTADLPETMRKKDIRMLLIATGDPQYPMDIVLDDFVLELDHDRLAQEIADFRKLEPAPELDHGSPLEKARNLVELKEKRAERLRRERVEANARLAARFPGGTWGFAGVSPLAKIYRDLPFDGTPGKTLIVRLARNETEGAQVVLRSPVTVRNVRIAVSPFTGPDGAVLPPARPYLVGFVKSPPPSYPVREESKWRPDPMQLDPAPFTLEANAWQPLWVDLATAPDQKPGIYRGHLRVTGDGMKALDIPLEAEVWPFTLPAKMTFPTVFVWSNNIRHLVYTKDKQAHAEYTAYRDGRLDEKEFRTEGARLLRQAEQRSRDLLLDHRIMPDNLYCCPPRLPFVADIRHGLERGGSIFNIVYVGHIPGIRAGEPYPEKSKRNLMIALRAEVAKYRKAGLLEHGYIYALDEVNADSWAAARDILGTIKKEFPDIPIITTLRDYTFGIDSGLRELVDAWVPVTVQYDKHRAEAAAARKAGKKVWYYVADYPEYPYANLHVEDPASAPRLLVGFMARQQKSDGFLYWQTTSWKQSTPLVTRWPLTEHTGESAVPSHTGAGMLMYPTPDGPVPSLRMKYLRDGLEDYEYTVLLRKIDPEKLSPEDRKPFQRLLDVPAAVSSGMTEYDQTGEALSNYRLELGRFLAKAAASGALP